MATKVRTITVNLDAGTAKFFTDLDAASAKIKQFGAHGVSSMQASSAALRELQGNFGNNTRAVERFIGTTLGLGPVLQKAFPLIGAVAFGGMIVELGLKAYQFFKTMADGPGKIEGAFRELNSSVQLSNDALRVSNDRLDNEIAKLEGRRENGLALMLDEARQMADKLAESLDKDLTALNKVLEERKVDIWAGLLQNKGTTSELQDYIKKFQQTIADVNEKGQATLDQARKEKDPAAAVRDAQAAWAKEVAAEYEKANAQIQTWIDRAKELAKPHMATYIGPGGSSYQAMAPGKDEGDLLKILQRSQIQLQNEAASVSLELGNLARMQIKQGLEANKAGKGGEDFGDGYAKKIAELRAQLQGVNSELAAVGQDHAAQLLAKAFEEADVEVANLNMRLQEFAQRKGVIGPAALLSPEQTAEMRKLFGDIAAAKDQTAWADKVDATTKKLQDEVKVQNLLAEAIGKGYEAVRAAHVEASVMQNMGAVRYSADPQGADAQRLRLAAGRGFDAEHATQATEAVYNLQLQIALERELASAQAKGAEALRQVELNQKIAQMEAAGATAAEIQAEKDLYAARRANADAADVAKINERIEATRRLSLAILGGAEAERKAALESKYAEMQRNGASAEAIARTRTADELDHQREITEEALKLVNARQNDLDRVNQEIGALENLKDQEEKIRAEKGDSLEIDKAMLAINISLRDLEKERLHLMAQQSLAMGDAKDGVKAFFQEMAAESKTAGQEAYDSLKQATEEAEDLVSKNLANMLTGRYKKGDWGKSLQQMGNSMVQSSLKELMKQGVAHIASLFGFNKPVDKPDGTFDNPFYVVVKNPDDGGGSSSISAPEVNALGGQNTPGGSVVDAFLKQFLSSAGAFLGGAGSGGGGGGSSDGLTPNVTSSISYGGAMAGGGPVLPGKAYRVNEDEDEYFIPSKAGRIVAPSKMGGGDVHVHNNVDARGSDLGAANRMARALERTHRSSVAAAVHIMNERQKRVPHRG